MVAVNDGLASYSCNDGYVLAGEGTRKCKDGMWRGEVPICEGDTEHECTKQIY